jgi:hypothetical protein
MSEVVMVLPNGKIGIDFDGKNIDPNELLMLLCHANLMFIRDYDTYFGAELASQLEYYTALLPAVDKRLGLNTPP